MTEQRLEGGRIRDPENGFIMPWYTSTCLEWLATLDLKGKRVFEYGVGDSTLWYRKQGAIVKGVDINEKWAGISETEHEASEYYYLRAIWSTGSTTDLYDIVVIDGSFRDECTKHALPNLKIGGYLIIDNYKQKSADLEHWPLTEKLIEGLPITIYKEPNHEDWQTAVITNV